MKKWTHFMFWIWGIFQIFIWTSLTAISFAFTIPAPLYKSEKKILSIIGFIVLKTTVLNSGFQRKNRFGKICTESWDIGKNVSKYAGLVWRPGFWYILINISRPGAYFSEPIFALKPWAWAGRFEYHEPYNRKYFFSDLFMGPEIF